MNLISNILDIDQSIEGEAYLKEFVKNIAINLNIKYVLIGHPIGDNLNRIQTDIVWTGTEFTNNFLYDLKDTPCELVLSGERVCIHDSNVCIDFPNDKLLQDMKIESYVGAPVVSKNKLGVSSILVLLDEKPMKDKEFFSIITEFLALRASAEIEKKHIEDRLKYEVEKRTKELLLANKKISSLNKSLEFERSEKKFKILFENSPVGMVRVDYETGEFLEINQSLLNLLQYTKEEFLSLSYWDVTPLKYKDQRDQQIKDLNKFDSFGPNEKEYIKKDGTLFPIKVSGFSSIDTDGRKIVWALIEDLTENKNRIKNQEIMFHQSKVASLGEMLGNIAHQWRQPLSMISTAATGSKLKKEVGILDDEEFYLNMDSINEQSQYLSKTIDDFRNFFLSDTSVETKVNIDIVIKKTISLIIDSFKSSNIEIISNLNAFKISITCNENLLIQALINILNNARDALLLINNTKLRKYVFIDIEEEKDFLSIKIKDNASGIPENIISKIFEPYFSTKYKSNGTGIGLYMTNQIITKHMKSRIEVQNVEFTYKNINYTGACFSIFLRK